MPLDLLVPHLLLAPDAPDEMRSLRLPALERWVARGDTDVHPATSAEAWLAAEYGLPARAPFAALSLASDLRDAEDDGDWLRADPVHLRIAGDGLFLHSITAAAPLSAEEARDLVGALQAHFAEDGIQFHVAAPERWYVRVPRGESPVTTPVFEALGRNVFGLLPDGGVRIRWRAAVTEAQMVLSGHAVNAARESARKPAVNSVWFWGEGALPGTIPRIYESVHANDAIARGLGWVGGAKVEERPRNLEALAETGGTASLAMIDTLSAPASSGDGPAWRAAAQALDAQFAAMPRLIQRFGHVRLVMPGRRGTRIATLTGGSGWRLFRGARPLPADA
jgi:hypothetical protein